MHADAWGSPGIVHLKVAAPGVTHEVGHRLIIAQALTASEVVAAQFSLCGSEGQRATGDRAVVLSKC